MEKHLKKRNTERKKNINKERKKLLRKKENNQRTIKN